MDVTVDCFTGCLIPISFGMMLGWTSPAFPYLLRWNLSAFPITLDNTALIAGYLMGAQAVGGLFANAKIMDSKVAVIFSGFLHFFGWCVMVGARDMYGLFVSRVSIGIGNAYGTAQLKRYVKETCDDKLSMILINYMPLAVNLGIILNYIIGASVSFRTMAVFSAIIPAVAVISFGAVKKKKSMQRETEFVVESTLNTAKHCSHVIPIGTTDSHIKQANVFKCLKNNQSRNALLLMLWLVLLQQFTGGAANIIYSHMIFSATENYNPNICSIIYALVFFFNTFMAITYAKNFHRKHNVLLSCAMCALTTGAMSLYHHIKENLLEINENFCWLPLVILVTYNVFHTFGIATVPQLIISDKVPEFGKNVASKLWLVQFSTCAIMSTKMFQELFSNYGMCIAYAFFSSVATFGFITILLYMDGYNSELKVNQINIIYVTKL